jgi:hypothetical protein
MRLATMKNVHFKFLKASSVPAGLLAVPAVLAFALAAFAQDAPPPPPPPGPLPMMHGGPGHMGEAMHGELGEGKTVTGVPLTAQISITRENTLADGNHIFKQTQTTLYRDSQGRVRREMTVDVGTPATGSVKHTMVMIKDPVSGKRYMLDPNSKTARQLPMGPQGRGARRNQAGGPGPDQQAKPMSASIQEQQLGTKTIDGVQADGRRVTRTIAAGEIGNEKPIEVSTERWFSPELQIPLLITHTDPMIGNVTTKVTSLTRGEPDASLFQVPPDYKIVSGRPDEPFYLPMQP